MFFVFLMSVSLFALLLTGLNMVRLSRFSKFMKSEIERVYQKRISGDRTAQYPNVHASYDNLKWYDVFNNKFDRMVVYDDSSY